MGHFRHRVAWALPALALAAAGMLWVGPRFVDWTPYKPDVEALIERQLGVGVTLRGGLQIDILPQPRITLAGVTVDGPGPHGAIRWMRGRLDPRALLTGRLIPRDLTLVEPDLTLPVRHGAAEGYDGETAVTIEDGTLALEGGPDWLPARLTEIDGRLTLGGGMTRIFAFDGEARLSGEPVGLSLEGRMGGELRLALAHGPSTADLTLEGAPDGEGGWRGRATLALKRADLLSALRVGAVARLLGQGPATLDARIRLDAGARLTVAIDALESARLSGSGSADLIPGAPPTLTLALALDRIRWEERTSSMKRLFDDLAQALGRFSETAIKLALRAKTIVTPAGTLREAALQARAFGGEAVIKRIEAMLPGETAITAGGLLSNAGAGLRFKGRTGLRAGDLRRGMTVLYPDLAAMLRAIPAERLRAAKASADLLVEPARLEITRLTGSIDGTVFAGTVSLNPAAGMDIALRADRVNLDRYRSDATPGHPATTVPLAALLRAGPSTRLSVYLERAILRGIPIGGLTIDMIRGDGPTVLLRMQAGDLGGASGSAELTVSTGGESSGKIDLTVPAPDRLLGALGLPARQAARFAALGGTTVRVDLSGSPRAGIEYALEALGIGGGLRLKGTAVPGLAASLTISDGALNLPSLTLFDLAGTCRRVGDGWTCDGLRAAAPGLRLEGRGEFSSRQRGRRLTLTLERARADFGRFASWAGLPLISEGEVSGSGVFRGDGPDALAALNALAGRVTLNGTVTLALRPGDGDGDRIGNLDRLRAKLADGFGSGVPLTGTADIEPESLSVFLTLDGRGVAARATAALNRATGLMEARLEAVEDGASAPAAVVTAEGAFGTPRVRLNGPWISGG